MVLTDIGTAAETVEGAAFEFTGLGASGYAKQHNGNTYHNIGSKYALAKRRSDDTLQEDQQDTQLLKVAAGGQTARIRYLLDKDADLDHRDPYDLPPLHYAVISEFEDAVDLFLVAANTYSRQEPCHGS